jgi:DNA invertase Pin-like site-specific DNA recombinase
VAARAASHWPWTLKEINRDGFGELIAAIEAGQVDVVIVRDIDRLTPQPDRLELL